MSGTDKWEYRVETVGDWKGAPDELVEATLNSWGEDGWEVIGAYSATSGAKVRLVAKRPLTAASRRRRNTPEYMNG